MPNRQGTGASQHRSEDQDREGTEDADNDGLTNLEEQSVGTDPNLSMILVADREVVAEAKRVEELEAASAGEVSNEPVVDKKAERRAAKQRKADEAQAQELHEDADPQAQVAASEAEQVGVGDEAS